MGRIFSSFSHYVTLWKFTVIRNMNAWKGRVVGVRDPCYPKKELTGKVLGGL